MFKKILLVGVMSFIMLGTSFAATDRIQSSCTNYEETKNIAIRVVKKQGGHVFTDVDSGSVKAFVNKYNELEKSNIEAEQIIIIVPVDENADVAVAFFHNGENCEIFFISGEDILKILDAMPDKNDTHIPNGIPNGIPMEPDPDTK